MILISQFVRLSVRPFVHFVRDGYFIRMTHYIGVSPRILCKIDDIFVTMYTANITLRVVSRIV